MDSLESKLRLKLAGNFDNQQRIERLETAILLLAKEIDKIRWSREVERTMNI